MRTLIYGGAGSKLKPPKTQPTSGHSGNLGNKRCRVAGLEYRGCGEHPTNPSGLMTNAWDRERQGEAWLMHDGSRR